MLWFQSLSMYLGMYWGSDRSACMRNGCIAREIGFCMATLEYSNTMLGYS